MKEMKIDVSVCIDKVVLFCGKTQNQKLLISTTTIQMSTNISLSVCPSVK